MGEPEYVRMQPLVTVEYGDRNGEPWLRVALTTEVTQNGGWSSRNIYDGPAPVLERELRVVPAPEVPRG